MDLPSAAAEYAIDMLKTGQAAAALEGLIIVYLMRQLSQAQAREQKRTDQIIDVIDETNKALSPLSNTLVAATEAVRRLEDDIHDLGQKVDGVPIRRRS